MRLSTKSRYGLRAVFDIAYNFQGVPAQIQDISRRQQISPRYLEQIFQGLKKAGILKSKRGPQGGYTLAKEPGQITVFDVIKATELDIKMVDCVYEPKKKRRNKDCGFDGNCVTQGIWKEAADMLADLFQKTSIESLCLRGENLGIIKE